MRAGKIPSPQLPSFLPARDDRNEHLNKRIKQAHEAFIPFPLVIGDKEQLSKDGLNSFSEAVQIIVESSKDKPFIPLGYPYFISKQVK